MTALSGAQRAARRGAMTGEKFLAAMTQLGFKEITARPGFLHEFQHPATGDRAYCMTPGRDYAVVLKSFERVLRSGRHHPLFL